MNRDRLLFGSLLLALLGCALRLWVATPLPGTYDEVGFVLALGRYDLLSFEPHFPGYPLAVLLARLAAGLGAQAPYAVAACVLVVAATPLAHKACGGGWGGLLAAGLLALAPLAVLEGARPMSDAAATAFLTAGLAGALAGRPFAAGLALGLATAAKPDTGLFLSAGVALVAGAPRGARLATGMAFVGAALPPLGFACLAAAAGAGGGLALAHEALRFVGGHLTDWGGGVVSQPDPPRLWLATAPLAGISGGSGLIRLPLALGGLALALAAPQRLRRGAVVTVLPYGLWFVFAQNLHHPRHALPLLPAAALLLGLGVHRIRAATLLRGALVAALLLGAATGGLAAAQRSRARGRTVDRLQAWLALQPGRIRVYAGRSGRPLRFQKPAGDVRPERSVEGARDDLASDPCPPLHVLVTSELEGAADLPELVDLDGIRLHRLSPSPVQGLATRREAAARLSDLQSRSYNPFEK